MDNRLEKALEFSNYMSTLNNHRKVLTEKFLESNVHYYDGGTFSVTKELLNFCHMLVQKNQDSVVLIDDNNLPVLVKNISKFFDDVLDLYFTNTQEYLAEYNKIKTNRSVKGLLDL
jgi:phosphatidylserine decarboxylase